MQNFAFKFQAIAEKTAKKMLGATLFCRTLYIDRPADPSTRQFTELLTAHGLVCCVTTPTHDRGGLLDVVAARDNATRPTVDVIDVGLSDHLLLRWAVPLVRPRPVYTTVTRRSWRQLDADAFRARLSVSTLCRPEA